MNKSSADWLWRAAMRSRRNALEAQLTLARQKAITVQIATGSHDAQVASRKLASLHAVQSAAERDFRDLLARWRNAGKVGDTEATGRR